MPRVSTGVAPVMFLVSGFAATQADAATTIQTFNQPASFDADVFIGGSTTAQFNFSDFAGGTFSTLGDSAIGAKNSGEFPTSDTGFVGDTSILVTDGSDVQIRFTIDGVTNFGLATFGDLPGDPGLGLLTIEYGELDSPVPEPETWAMMAAGFGVIGAAARASRRRQLQAAAA